MKKPPTPTTKIKPWTSDHMVKPAELIDVRLPSNLTLVDRRTWNLLIWNAWERIDGGNVDHVISIAELKGLHTGSNSRVSETIKRLMGAVIEVTTPGRRGSPVTRRAQLLGGNDMDEEERAGGVLSYSFDPRLISIIRNSTAWGQLRKQVMAAFTSKYALALYELGERRINLRKFSEEWSIQELRDYLGVPLGKLDRFADLNRRAIQPAVDEVNAFSVDFSMNMFPLTKGRAVVGVRVSWMAKTDEERHEAKAEINRTRVGRKARVTKTVEALAERQEAIRLELEEALKPQETADFLGDKIPY